MVRTSLSTTVLPRARVLTDALVAPPSQIVAEPEVLALRQRLESELHPLACSLGVDRPLRVDGYRLRDPRPGQPAERPFAWSPWTARRPIALEAIRTWLATSGLSPLRAVDQAVEVLRARADGRSRSLGEWLNHLSPGARGVAQAEAVTWATQLIGALEWGRLDGAVIGGDRSVAFEAAPQVRLHARIDLRISLTGNRRSPEAASLFLAMTGRPGTTAVEELGLAALTLALHPRPGVPARVVGWWPQCGRAAIAEVDLALLHRSAEAVLRSVRAATESGSQPGSPIRIERTDVERSARPLPSPCAGEVPIAS